MAAPTLQAQGNIAAVTTGNLAITLPTYAANDIVVITTVGWVPNTTTGTNTQSLASPWTKYSPDITTITGGIIDAEYAFWWARATSASSLGTTVTITRPTSWDTGTDTCWAGRAYVIRGCETSGNPYDELVATAISTAANPAFPAVTVNAGERNVIVFMAKADNTATPTAATGYTVGTEASTTTGTDAAFQSYSDVTNTSVSAVTPTGGTAPAQGGSVYWGVSFKKPLVTITRTASDTGTGTESATGARVGNTITRTASDTGTGTESATGVFFTVFQRTASDAGTGTEFADGTHLHTRTASASGAGTESATPNIVPGTVVHQVTASASGSGTESATGTRVALTVTRTASDTGTGTESATSLRIARRTASDAGTGTESATPAVIRIRTATATGVGTESASRLTIRFRTASDTGTGTETAARRRIVLRTGSTSGTGTESAVGASFKARNASASGTGTESASGAYIRVRTASNTGVGTETVTRILVALRTASNAGTGSSAVVSARALFRSATATGAGTETGTGVKVFRKTASASGVGATGPTTTWKSFIFRPPVDGEFRWADYLDDSIDAKFFGKVRQGKRASNIYKLTDGSFVTIDPLNPALVDKIYFGGHNNFVSPEEKADLIAAGYTVT